MGQRFRADPSGLGRGYPIIGKNSVEFSHADPIRIDSNGWLDIIGNAVKPLGYYTGQGETMDSANQTTGGKVTPDYCYAENVEMVFGADQDATQTDVGAYADMGTSSTGAFVLNLAAGSDGIFLVLGFDPEGDGTDSDIVVVAAERQKDAYAQA